MDEYISFLHKNVVRWDTDLLLKHLLIPGLAITSTATAR